MTNKRFSELTPAEKIAAAIAQDAADNRAPTYSAERLKMSLADVEATRAAQKAAWEAGKAARLKAAQIVAPAQAPANVCISCIALFVRGIRIARAAGVAEPRSIACPHTSSTGERYNVAFLAPSDPPKWLLCSEVVGADLNALYAGLMDGGWQRAITNGDAANAAISAAASRGLKMANLRKWVPLFAALAVLK